MASLGGVGSGVGTVTIAFFVAGANANVVINFPEQRGINPLVFHEGFFLTVFPVFHQSSHENGKRIIDQNAIVTKGSASGSVFVGFKTDASAVTKQVGLYRGVIDDTTRASDSEKGGIGAPLNGNPVDVEGVKRYVREEVVTGQVCSGETANPGSASIAPVQFPFQE